MSDSTSLQLYKWVTEEMGYFPRKSCGSSRSVLTPQDLDFLMASKRDLWDHVMKHVHSVSKVQHVRKNILLSRLKKNKLQGIQKCDEIGNKIHLLGEVKHAQAKLQKAREEAQETERLVKNQTSLLKIAGCRRRHLQNIADNIEKKCILLKMSGKTIQALTDAFNSSSKCISLVKAPRISMHSSNIEHHSTISSVEEYTKELPYVPAIPSVSVECKRFLEKCISMAKDLLDEKLETLSIERTSSNSSAISEFSQLCIDSRFMDFDTLKVYNTMSETKKNELKSFISNNVKDFSGQHLFESLLSFISEKDRKTPIFYDDHYSTLHQKMYGEEQINELERLFSEKLTHLHASVTHDLAIAAQEKVVALRMKNELKRLMSCIEKDLNKMFPDNEMQEKMYELIETMIEEASVGGAIAYLKKSLNEMLVESSDNSLVYQMKKLDEQLKTMEDEMIGHRKALRHLKSMREEIGKNITSNQDKVRRCLLEIKSETISSTLGDVETLVELPRREVIMFNEYPLECHRKSLFLGKEVMDSRLLMNGHTLGDAMCEKEGNYAQWVKLTLGMAPYSSTEHILEGLFKAEGLLELLSGPALNYESGMLQSCIDKVPGLLKCLEEDEKKSEAAVTETCNFIKMERSETEKEVEKAYSIYNTWSEEKINKCVPECDLLEGKTFLQWYYDILSFQKKKELP